MKKSMGLFSRRMDQPSEPAPEAAPEPPKKPMGLTKEMAKKIMEEKEGSGLFNFTFEDYSKTMDDFNAIQNELGSKLESWGVKIEPSELLDSPSSVMGLKDLNQDQKKELMAYLDEKDAFEVNRKWDHMQKQIADYVM